jgi:hypothetical protein
VNADLVNQDPDLGLEIAASNNPRYRPFLIVWCWEVLGDQLSFLRRMLTNESGMLYGLDLAFDFDRHVRKIQ